MSCLCYPSPPKHSLQPIFTRWLFCFVFPGSLFQQGKTSREREGQSVRGRLESVHSSLCFPHTFSADCIDRDGKQRWRKRAHAFGFGWDSSTRMDSLRGFFSIPRTQASNVRWSANWNLGAEEKGSMSWHTSLHLAVVVGVGISHHSVSRRQSHLQLGTLLPVTPVPLCASLWPLCFVDWKP